MRPRVAGVAEKVVSTLQECNEITVKHMILLHVSVMISHANMYVTHVLLCVAFLIWLILYISVLRTHAFVINSVEIRFIDRVGFFNAMPWSSAKMSSCLQISYCP